MRFSRKLIGLVLILLIIPVLVYMVKLSQQPKAEVISVVASPSPTVTPAFTPFGTYNRPVIKKADKYNIFLIGDSMTHAFGPRGGIFTELLTKEYPDRKFEVYNFAEAGYNIQQVSERFDEEIQASEELRWRPITSGDPVPNLIIIESFGYNPLSQLGRDEGMRKQEEVLTEIIKKLSERYPETVIMFLATIAPDKKTYSESATGADAQGRWIQAEERIEYITNHIDYAKEHNIPLIDAYHPSLDSEGDGDTVYINPDDDIHPSAEGLAHIARIMVKRIQEEKIFP